MSLQRELSSLPQDQLEAVASATSPALESTSSSPQTILNHQTGSGTRWRPAPGLVALFAPMGVFSQSTTITTGPASAPTTAAPAAPVRASARLAALSGQGRSSPLPQPPSLPEPVAQGGPTTRRPGPLSLQSQNPVSAAQAKAKKTDTRKSPRLAGNQDKRPQTPAQRLDAEAARKAAAAWTNFDLQTESFVRGEPVASSGPSTAPSRLPIPMVEEGAPHYSLVVPQAPAKPVVAPKPPTAQEQKITAIAKSSNPLARAREYYLETVRDELRMSGTTGGPKIPKPTLDMAAPQVLRLAQQIASKFEEQLKEASEGGDAEGDIIMGNSDQGASAADFHQLPATSTAPGPGSAARVDPKGKGLATDDQQTRPEPLNWVLGAEFDQPQAQVHVDSPMIEVEGAADPAKVNHKVADKQNKLPACPAQVNQLADKAPNAEEKGDEPHLSGENGAQDNLQQPINESNEDHSKTKLSAPRKIVSAAPNPLNNTPDDGAVETMPNSIIDEAVPSIQPVPDEAIAKGPIVTTTEGAWSRIIDDAAKANSLSKSSRLKLRIGELPPQSESNTWYTSKATISRPPKIVLKSKPVGVRADGMGGTPAEIQILPSRRSLKRKADALEDGESASKERQPKRRCNADAPVVKATRALVEEVVCSVHPVRGEANTADSTAATIACCNNVTVTERVIFLKRELRGNPDAVAEGKFKSRLVKREANAIEDGEPSREEQRQKIKWIIIWY